MTGAAFTLRVAITAALLASCGAPATPTPTKAGCPTGSTLTYENFGRAFMQNYCTRCHDSSKNGSERNGAPLYHDFDTKGGIIAVANHVDWYAAAGPESINEIMPPDDGATPTLDERYQLGQWLACELALFSLPKDSQ